MRMGRAVRGIPAVILVALVLGGIGVETARSTAESTALAADAALRSILLVTLPLLTTLMLWNLELVEDSAAVRYGQSRRVLAVPEAGLRLGLLTVIVALLTAAGLAVTRGTGDPLLLEDLVVSLPVAVMGTWAIAGLLAAARLWAGRVGLVGALVVSWLLGAVDFVVAASVPHGHIRHLLGVGEALPFPQWVSMIALGGFAGLLGFLASLRVRP